MSLNVACSSKISQTFYNSVTTNSKNAGLSWLLLCMDLIEKKPDKDVIYTLRCAHQKQAQLILLADQKAQILSGLVLVVLTLLGTRLIYMNTDRFFVSMEPVTAILLLLFLLWDRCHYIGNFDGDAEFTKIQKWERKYWCY